MTAKIDYEKEYNNRARVKEHPQIFARWDREAAAYREQSAKAGAQLDVGYGPTERQRYDYFPAEADSAATPLAMFIHGGWWRSLDPRSFSQSARGLNGRGISVAVVGYDLCPTVSIATIIEQMRAVTLALWRKHNKRITVYGHSAGGHLTACMVAQDWKKLDSSTPADLTPAGYAISGLFDLAPLIHITPNQDFKLDAAQAQRNSPLHWDVPNGRALDAVVGGDESSEFLRQSRAIAEAWEKRGVETRYEAVVGKNHFDVVDALTDPQSAMTQRIAALAQKAHGLTLQASH